MKQKIEDFYTAFKNLNAEEMVSHYHDDIVFHDPAFGELKGERAKNMWRMLCASQKGKDFKVIFSDIIVNDISGTAHWEAMYNFSKTGRKVHNRIDASFKFKDGLIIEHRDHFNLHRWASQAMGFKGWLLGNTSFFKKKLHLQTHSLLDKFTNV